MSVSPISLSLVIPAYNEERRLPASLRDIQSFFKQLPEGLEILVIVEKSSDRTVEAAKKAVYGDQRFQIIDNQVHRGKGFAVKSGMLRASGDIVIFMDADLSTPLAEVFAFVQHFAENPGTDVIIGSRAEAKSQVIKKQSWLRRNMGRTFNKFVKATALSSLPPGIADTQCGFKGFRQKACKEIFTRQKTDGFAFDVEILMLASALGYKIDVLPVRWVNSPDSKVRILIDPLKMLWDLFRIRRLVRRSIRELPPSPELRASR
jgi:dolichyl-phosphate beta-glucosyltransferase